MCTVHRLRSLCYLLSLATLQYLLEISKKATTFIKKNKNGLLMFDEVLRGLKPWGLVGDRGLVSCFLYYW
jgi:hypothetical protein